MSIKIVEMGPERLAEYSRIPIKVKSESAWKWSWWRVDWEACSCTRYPLPGLTSRIMIHMESFLSTGPENSTQPIGDFSWRWTGKNRPEGRQWHSIPMGSTCLKTGEDLSVLWDIRVDPAYRGVGIPLFRHAADWSRKHGCRQMKVETQNVNVPACRFYQRMGCQLGEIRLYGYAAVPAVADEVMLNWYLDL